MISMVSSSFSRGKIDVIAKYIIVPPLPSATVALTTSFLQFKFHHRNPTLSPWRKYKSSVPSSNNDHKNDVYERASQNAAEFDHKYCHVLSSSSSSSSGSSSSSSWRQRQMAITKLNPMRPYPTLPTQLLIHQDDDDQSSIIHNNNNYPTSFFPPYAQTGIVPHSTYHDRILLHDASSIARMKKSATLARQLLDYIIHPSISRPGHTTDMLNNLLHRATVCHSAYPSPLNYSGFPKSVCTSINEVVCHGIPDSRPLKVGDILSCDVSVYLDGVHGDNCGTIVVGDVDDENDTTISFEMQENGRGGNDISVDEKNVDLLSWDWYSDWIATTSSSSVDAGRNEKNKPMENDASSSAVTVPTNPMRRDWPTISIPQKTNFASLEEEERIVTARRLVQAALESRDEGVAACKPGGCLSEVGAAIHAVADAYGYDTVRHYRGHGISSEFHCAPFVKHFRNLDALELVPGMIFTIEPMITEGNAECTEWSDNWTVATLDGGRAAQFEHTVLITEEGVEILTLPF